ncbi:hypothetical protein ACX9MO_14735 [Pseudooceanicola sp. 502str34]
MNITFSPVAGLPVLAVSKSGDVLTLNGETFDFTALPTGATLPKEAITCEWISGDVSRDESGVLTVPMILPHGPNAPEATRFPAPMTDVEDGTVALPLYDMPAPEEEVQE